MKKIFKAFLLILLSTSFTLLSNSCNSDDSKDGIENHIEDDIEDKNALKIIAHRGFWNTAKSAENSRTSVLLALENKFNGIEIDVRMSADSVLYLNHDPDLNGVNIKNSNSELIRNLTLKNGERIIAFDEFIDIVSEADYDVQIFVDIKESGNLLFDKETTRRVIEKLDDKLISNKVYILSFSLPTMIYSKDFNKDIKTLYLVNSINFLDYDKIKNAKVDGLSLNYNLILNNPSLAQEIKDKGYPLNVYTVNLINDFNILKSLPINSITTDVPDILKKLR